MVLYHASIWYNHPDRLDYILFRNWILLNTIFLHITYANGFCSLTVTCFHVSKLGTYEFCFKMRHVLFVYRLYILMSIVRNHTECLKLIFCEVPFSEPLYYYVYLSHVAFKFWILLRMNYLWIGLCRLHSHLSTI